MSKLAKWFPFKFKRKKKQEHEADPVPVHVERADARRGEGRPTSMLADSFWRDPFALFGDMDRFFGDFSPASFQPSVDVVDDGKHLRFTAELPGLGKEDIDVSVHDGVLTLKGEKRSEQQHEEDGCYRLERYFGHFQRVLPLPPDVDPEGAEANFDNGLLTVRFPKTHAATRPRRIEIG